MTLDKTRLVALLEDGTYVVGETNIDVPQHDGTLRIVDLFAVKEAYIPRLKELISVLSNTEGDAIQSFVTEHGVETDLATIHASVNTLFDYYVSYDLPALHADIPAVLASADYIIVASGDLYTSILPNMIIGDCAQHIATSPAKKIMVTNLFTKYGETHGFALSDILREYAAYLGDDVFDAILVHDWDTHPVPSDLYHSYIDEKKQPIRVDVDDDRVVLQDFVSTAGYVRHDIAKLREAFVDAM